MKSEPLTSDQLIDMDQQYAEWRKLHRLPPAKVDPRIVDSRIAAVLATHYGPVHPDVLSEAAVAARSVVDAYLSDQDGLQ